MQHSVFPAPAFVQSAAFVQSWTCWVPEHAIWSFVGHEAAGMHVAVSGPFVQLGMDPPVIGISAQHA